jgi:hypothetical protein
MVKHYHKEQKKVNLDIYTVLQEIIYLQALLTDILFNGVLLQLFDINGSECGEIDTVNDEKEGKTTINLPQFCSLQIAYEITRF